MAATGGQGAKKGTDGPYLFGHFTAADAMFAPVVLRFRTYRLSEAGECGLLGPEDVAYCRAISDLEGVQEWIAAAAQEAHRIAKYEV